MDGDGRLITTSSNKPQKDWLSELCSFYMSIGVPYEEFWHGDPCKLKFYLRAYEYKQEQENQFAWLCGLYNHKAVSVALDIFSYGMNGKKGKQPGKYLEYPIAITDREKEAEKQRKIKHTLDFVRKGNNNG